MLLQRVTTERPRVVMVSFDALVARRRCRCYMNIIVFISLYINIFSNVNMYTNAVYVSDVLYSVITHKTVVIHIMKIAIAIALLGMAATANDACTATETAAIGQCIGSKAQQIQSAATAAATGDKSKLCPAYQAYFGCFKSCYCANPAVAQSQKSFETILKANGITCSLKCGGGGGGTGSATGSASAGCTAADLTKMGTCIQSKQKSITAAGSDKSKVCAAYKDITSCYPKCYCDTAAAKAAIDGYNKAGKALGCSAVTCGGTSAATSTVAVTTFTVTALIAAALKNLF